jgi:3-dehydroquinate synthase
MALAARFPVEYFTTGGVEVKPVMPNVHVNLGSRGYEIVIGSGQREVLTQLLAGVSRNRKAFLVSDANVAPHAEAVRKSLDAAGWHTGMVVLPPGEAQKSLATLSHLYDQLVDFHADRKTAVVAMGGGVIGDVAGFAAATFNRGLPLVMAPTTLLAMVDSSVGGKVGINHPRAKNLIGAFYQPRGVWIETSFLDTLPEREFRSGLAEVVKYGVIADPILFESLEHQQGLFREPAFVEDVIRRCCELKADVVEYDEHETLGHRAILNYGHTFAHAFETVAGYGTLLHGEAVAIGMVCAAKLAHRMNWLDEASTGRLVRLLETMQLPVRPDPAWQVEAMLETMRHDKKAVDGQLRFVLPRWIGKVEQGVPVEEPLVRDVLTEAACHG